jgi:hypothetical protein
MKNELYVKYPSLFRQTNLPSSESCMHWGIQTGDGWLPIIERLCELIKDIPGVEFSEIKEKFGRLSINVKYILDTPDDTKELVKSYINESIDMSFTACEKCGMLGERKTIDGWLSVLCPVHENEAKNVK